MEFGTAVISFKDLANLTALKTVTLSCSLPIHTEMHYHCYLYLWLTNSTSQCLFVKGFFRINNNKKTSCCTFLRHAKIGSILLIQEIFITLKQRKQDNFQFCILIVGQKAVLINLYESLKRRIYALMRKLKNKCSCWFPAAMFGHICAGPERDTNMASPDKAF